jgi:hypothetical protein
MVENIHDYECMTCGGIIPAGTYYWDHRIYKEMRKGRIITPIAAERLTIQCLDCVDENKVAEYAQRSPDADRCRICKTKIPEGTPYWALITTKNRFNKGAYEPEYSEIFLTWCDHCANNKDLLPESKIILNKLLSQNTLWFRTYQKTFHPSQHEFCEHCGTKQ